MRIVALKDVQPGQIFYFNGKPDYYCRLDSRVFNVLNLTFYTLEARYEEREETVIIVGKIDWQQY